MKWLLATTWVIKVIWTANFSGGPLNYSFWWTVWPPRRSNLFSALAIAEFNVWNWHLNNSCQTSAFAESSAFIHRIKLTLMLPSLDINDHTFQRVHFNWEIDFPPDSSPALCFCSEIFQEIQRLCCVFAVRFSTRFSACAVFLQWDFPRDSAPVLCFCSEIFRQIHHLRCVFAVRFSRRFSACAVFLQWDFPRDSAPPVLCFCGYYSNDLMELQT